MNQAYNFAELFELTRAIVSHGEEYGKINFVTICTTRFQHRRPLTTTL
jgi:hypothetical protein